MEGSSTTTRTDRRRAFAPVAVDGASGNYPGLPCEFETCPDWVPTMDTGQRSARITVKTIVVHRFDHRANRVAKVRNVSRLGSQLLLFLISAI